MGRKLVVLCVLSMLAMSAYGMDAERKVRKKVQGEGGGAPKGPPAPPKGENGGGNGQGQAVAPTTPNPNGGGQGQPQGGQGSPQGGQGSPQGGQGATGGMGGSPCDMCVNGLNQVLQVRQVITQTVNQAILNYGCTNGAVRSYLTSYGFCQNTPSFIQLRTELGKNKKQAPPGSPAPGGQPTGSPTPSPQGQGGGGTNSAEKGDAVASCVAYESKGDCDAFCESLQLCGKKDPSNQKDCSDMNWSCWSASGAMGGILQVAFPLEQLVQSLPSPQKEVASGMMETLKAQGSVYAQQAKKILKVVINPESTGEDVQHACAVFSGCSHGGQHKLEIPTTQAHRFSYRAKYRNSN